MSQIRTHMKAYRKECILAPLFKCMEAMVDLYVPLCMANLIDIGIANHDTAYIWKTGLLLLALAAGGLLLSVIAQWFSARAAVNIAANIRSNTFRHIQSLSFSSADTLGSDTLITRLTSDTNQIQTGINMGLRLLLRSPFIVFGAVIMAFKVDAKAAIVFLITVPLLALVVYGIMLITVPKYKKVQSKLDGVMQSTRENLTGVRVIRAFNLQQEETARFTASNEALTVSSKSVGRFSALTNPLTYVIINLATAALLYVGAIRVDSGSLSQGQVIALVNYMAQILVELVKLANLIVTLTKTAASANRIDSVIKTVSDMPTDPSALAPSGKGSVEFSHVGLQYAGGGEEALTDITFTAPAGSTIGVIGGTGSGKSSLVNMIPRFYDAKEGTVFIDGTDVRSLNLKGLREEVGSVLQKAVLFSGTIRDNVRFGNENATDEEIWQALETAQAADFVRQKPLGLDEPVEQGGRNLSGGQRQRLGIARALVRKPRILILDDSASALDFATDAALRKAIRQLDDHPTTFIVSQRVSSILYADQILVLADGTLVGKGTHDELLKTCEVYKEIYESQIRKEDTGDVA